ncbi:MAG: polysaccharide pyruvyl transferase family protein [Sodaliphilus sp.]
MKVATITFHGAHNYGSMLQAYALQQAISSCGVECEIINFRSLSQKKMYRVFTFRRKWTALLKDLSHILFYFSLRKKYELFENFLKEYLVTSKREFYTLEELFEADFKYDKIVCGSDQIWKCGIEDFNYAYLLPFAKCAKVSYAASFGPSSIFPVSEIEKFRLYLKDFKAISVREEGTKNVIETVSERKDISVVCDPVFLLDSREWLKLISKEPIIKDDYIFFYTLFADSEMIKIAKEVSKHYGLPIVISNFSNLYDLMSGFKMSLRSGPKEFLNLLYFSKYVCTSSFHASALSLILNKQLISINGNKDNRISSILKTCNLKHISISSVDEVKNLPDLLISDFELLNSSLNNYSNTGWNFIKTNIIIDD